MAKPSPSMAWKSRVLRVTRISRCDRATAAMWASGSDKCFPAEAACARICACSVAAWVSYASRGRLPEPGERAEFGWAAEDVHLIEAQ